MQLHDVVEHLAAAADASDSGPIRAGGASDGAKGGPNQRGSSGDLMLPSAVVQRFGRYEPAIDRWERLHGPAPAPVKPGRNGRLRLNPAFAEWMMGTPAGWITDVPGLTDNQALHAIGNGVVPQQAAAALTVCLHRLTEGPA